MEGVMNGPSLSKAVDYLEDANEASSKVVFEMIVATSRHRHCLNFLLRHLVSVGRNVHDNTGCDSTITS